MKFLVNICTLAAKLVKFNCGKKSLENQNKQCLNIKQFTFKMKEKLFLK